jgi:hypothetical protein
MGAPSREGKKLFGLAVIGDVGAGNPELLGARGRVAAAARIGELARPDCDTVGDSDRVGWEGEDGRPKRAKPVVASAPGRGIPPSRGFVNGEAGREVSEEIRPTPPAGAGLLPLSGLLGPATRRSRSSS